MASVLGFSTSCFLFSYNNLKLNTEKIYDLSLFIYAVARIHAIKNIQFLRQVPETFEILNETTKRNVNSFPKDSKSIWINCLSNEITFIPYPYHCCINKTKTKKCKSKILKTTRCPLWANERVKSQQSNQPTKQPSNLLLWLERPNVRRPSSNRSKLRAINHFVCVFSL